MDTLKLNSKQIQVAIDQLTAQPEGVNKLMAMALNSLMKAERATYLDAAQFGNKAKRVPQGDKHRSSSSL
ncbi:hypothetical protein V6238_00015 [Marinomonas arenicola]